MAFMREFFNSDGIHAMKLIPLAEVCSRIGASRHFVKTNAATGRFPQPLQLGERKCVWMLSEVEAWLQERAAARPELVHAEQAHS